MDDRRFSCISCQVILEDQDKHVAHHKSDFHRFNLKRKMINLPPVTMEQFNLKVAEIKKAEDVKDQKETVECKVCRKKFSSENTYKTHVNSSKHKERAAAAERAKQEKEEAGEDAENVAPKSPTEPEEPKEKKQKPSEEQEEVADDRTLEEIIDAKIKSSRKILLEECMFCLQKFDDLETNVEHMEKHHGFWIPDREHLKDLPGFIEYLGEKISVGNVCLWCNEKGPAFYSLNAVQQHMNTLAHCKLAYEPEDEAEYSEFYDFSSNENALIESTISDASSEYQIIFKNGMSIGHRSLQRYYRQSYKPSENRAVVLANSGQFKIAGWYRDAISQDKLRQSYEASMKNNRDQMNIGVRANFLWRFRKDNVTTRNSGR